MPHMNTNKQIELKRSGVVLRQCGQNYSVSLGAMLVGEYFSLASALQAFVQMVTIANRNAA